MNLPSLLLCGLLAVFASSKSFDALALASTSSSTSSDLQSFILSGTRVIRGSTLSGSIPAPTGLYQTYEPQVIVSTTSSLGNDSIATIASPAATSTTLVGSLHFISTISLNAAITATSSQPVNTQPCNNYPEFCDRKYSNITEVCAHNSAFVVPANAASNQAIPILGQLNDGVRMIQGETHYVNNTIFSCHTSCDLLNTGPLINELKTVADWIKDNPYNVITILLVNSDYVNVEKYISPIMESGLAPFLYVPPKQPMRLDDWPTLGEMILSGKKVVVFMDYNANQNKVPYILDEFSHMWETPFSPVDPAFPCTQQRPPGLPPAQARNEYLYLLNQNLNIGFSIGGSNLEIPNVLERSRVNAAGNGTQAVSSLGNTTTRCTEDWGRPPNFLLVDFYNYGNFNGSVFEVAAKHNNVTYSRKCCGLETQLSVAHSVRSISLLPTLAFVALLALFPLV